jgi:hypothetical protein
MGNVQNTTPETLVAEYEAVVRALLNVMRWRSVPQEHHAEHISYICLAIAAETWAQAHLELDEVQASKLFGEMAEEAVKSYFDSHVVQLAKRGLVKGAFNV